MSKGLSYKYTGTKGHIVAVASSLPKNPDELLSKGWKDITDPRAKESSNSRAFREESTGLRIRFDKGTVVESGFKGTISTTQMQKIKRLVSISIRTAIP